MIPKALERDFEGFVNYLTKEVNMSTLEDLARCIDEVITHRLDVLTEGDWFNELVEKR